MRDAVQRDPIIVDDASKIVLDGMHRLAALKRVGAKAAVCSVADYLSDEVKLFRWFRFVENPGDALIFDLQQTLGLTVETPLLKDVRACSSTSLICRGRAYAAPSALTLQESIEAIREFDSIVKESGIPLGYVDENTVAPELLSGNYLALITPKLGKEEVMRAASEGNLLPPKSTLHVLPVRPMGINYPIESLRSKEDMLERILSTRNRRRIEAPSFYHGRLYREPVVVFE